jgi:hypothetical protein
MGERKRLPPDPVPVAENPGASAMLDPNPTDTTTSLAQAVYGGGLAAGPIPPSAWVPSRGFGRRTDPPSYPGKS